MTAPYPQAGAPLSLLSAACLALLTELHTCPCQRFYPYTQRIDIDCYSVRGEKYTNVAPHDARGGRAEVQSVMCTVPGRSSSAGHPVILYTTQRVLQLDLRHEVWVRHSGTYLEPRPPYWGQAAAGADK